MLAAWLQLALRSLSAEHDQPGCSLWRTGTYALARVTFCIMSFLAKAKA